MKYSNIELSETIIVTNIYVYLKLEHGLPWPYIALLKFCPQVLNTAMLCAVNTAIWDRHPWTYSEFPADVSFDAELLTASFPLRRSAAVCSEGAAGRTCKYVVLWD